jgi:hypothetical protein
MKQVLDILEKRASEGLKRVFFDTPGQIEVFTWSASGMIITETLALKFPTVSETTYMQQTFSDSTLKYMFVFTI